MLIACQHYRLKEIIHFTHDEVKQVNQLQFDSLPVNAQQIRTATRHDPLLAHVLQYTMSNWPTEPTEAEKPYFHKRFEITAEDDCLLWGIRVIIPNTVSSTHFRGTAYRAPRNSSYEILSGVSCLVAWLR